MENPFETIAKRLSNIEELLLDLKHKPLQTVSSLAHSDELLSVAQAAQLLNLTTATVYGMVYEKRIPFSKPSGSGRLYFVRSELIEWVKNGRKSTSDELGEQARQQIASRINRRQQSKVRKGGAKA